MIKPVIFTTYVVRYGETWDENGKCYQEGCIKEDQLIELVKKNDIISYSMNKEGVIVTMRFPFIENAMSRQSFEIRGETANSFVKE